MTYKVASLAAFAVPPFIAKGAVIVSSASDLTNCVLSKLSKVFALLTVSPVRFEPSSAGKVPVN